MKIGVDIDGVLYDLMPKLGDYFATSTGRPREEFVEPTSWEFHKDWGVEPEAAFRLFCNAVNERAVWRWGDPMPGSVEALQSLIDAGHTVHLVTDRLSIGQAGVASISTTQWLADHSVPFTTLTFARDKTLVQTDVFIDDRPLNAEEISAAGTPVWLHDAAHNKDFEWPRRVTSLTEFAELMCSRVMGGKTPVAA